jgi:hypothetical protein
MMILVPTFATGRLHVNKPDEDLSGLSGSFDWTSAR